MELNIDLCCVKLFSPHCVSPHRPGRLPPCQLATVLCEDSSAENIYVLKVNNVPSFALDVAAQ
jgi:hypothetical protein